MLQNIEQLAQPAILLALGGSGPLLVLPMGSNTELGNPLHFMSADLHLDPLVLRSDHAGMQGSVIVRFRGRDVILEATRNDRVAAVDLPKRLIALLHAIDRHPKRHDIGKLLEPDILALHLAPDRIRGFGTPRNLSLQADRLEALMELGNDLADHIAALIAQKLQTGQDGGSGVRIKLYEGKVFEFILHILDADALRQGRVDIHGFMSNPASLLRILDEVQRAHIVKPVRQLHQQHSDIFRHGQHELAKIFRLLRLIGLQLDTAELCNTIDQTCDFRPEYPVDFFESYVRIFNHVMQQPGNDRSAIKTHLCENAGNFDRMREVRVTRSARLTAMRFDGEDIGLVQNVFVGVRVIGPDTLDHFVLSHHRPFAIG